ncbi:hypothetical protein EDC02_5943 [Micromonospora sp. Llam0]|uniref:DUF7426 family protein n=1 Tax=Micromonospora sp. Llam0 TaxID=2485143 RepID=UPI000F48362B|nr:hypothetical protein [Micromonospora sp. Llam0]ROO51079.1 hypothetical protein EDC02_5943 [Micromonospora sp. Llam0]
MPEFSGLTSYFDPGLILAGVPGRDKVERSYPIPLASAELGLWCRLVAQTTGTISEDSTEDELREAAAAIEALPDLPGDKHLTLSQRMLGTAYAAMVADGVADPYIEYCGMCAYFYVLGGDQAAARWWRSGGRPEALRPAANRAQRRDQAKKAAKKAAPSTGGSRTAAATGTRKPASTSGTKSPRKSAGRGAAKG